MLHSHALCRTAGEDSLSMGGLLLVLAFLCSQDSLLYLQDNRSVFFYEGIWILKLVFLMTGEEMVDV